MRTNRIPLDDGPWLEDLNQEELEFMGRTGRIPLSQVPTGECPRCGCSTCCCEAIEAQYRLDMAENAPAPTVPPPLSDEEQEALWWHWRQQLDEIEYDRWGFEGEEFDNG